MASHGGGPSPVLTRLTVGDDPDAWRSAGFAVDDSGRCRIGQVEIALMGPAGGPGIHDWTFSGDVPDDLDGITTARTVDPANAADAGAAPHPNGCQIIDHVVVLTPNTGRTVDAFGAVGLPALRTRETDTYGLPMLQTFFRSGEVILELIGPEEPTGDDPATFFGLAHTVADLDATAAMLGDGLGRIKDAVQDGRRIATLRHKQFGISVPTALMTSES